MGYSGFLFAKTKVEGVRVWDAPDSVRVVFDVSGSPEYQIFTLSNPNRVVIDLKNTQWSVQTKPELAHSSINTLRHSIRHEKDLRVVLDLNEKVKPSSFVLVPNNSYGHRLVVDLPIQTNAQAKVSPPREVAGAFAQRPFLVAIDPGHGGEDPGAIGRRYRTKEKDIVLNVATVLAKKINRTPGMEAYLVRTGDYYINLRQRITKARREGADLFISIHADSFKDPKANGASVYILSDKGESNEAARWLAERENRADLIGGVSLDDKGDLLAQVLLDLSQSASKAASYELGEDVLQNLAKVTRLHKNKVQQAGFVVLKSPDIPSILVELGFVSNPLGERNLSRPYFRENLAQALLEGIKAYKARRGQPLYPTGSNQQYARIHKVKAGDSLEVLALKYNTTVDALKAENKLRSDAIRVGQVLQLPQ